MTAASTSDARKRNAEKANIQSIQSYALERSSRDCQRGQHDDCNGLAYDPDEHCGISCMCGCRIANGTDVSISATSPARANLASLRGNGEATDIDCAVMAASAGWLSPKQVEQVKADAWAAGWRKGNLNSPFGRSYENNPYREAKP